MNIVVVIMMNRLQCILLHSGMGITTFETKCVAMSTEAKMAFHSIDALTKITQHLAHNKINAK